MNTIQDIRNKFLRLKSLNKIAENGTYEIVNAHFVCDENVIFGSLNTEYAKHELEWYESMSLNVNDIPGKTPTIWKQVATPDGFINSNYGWCIFSEENGFQYKNVIETLKKDKYSRQGQMIYTRPSMHTDWNSEGKHDFICTTNVSLLIRENKLIYTVSMRSNDAVFGFKNDLYWHQYVYEKAFNELKETYPELERTNIIWFANSLHVYSRHFDLIS